MSSQRRHPTWSSISHWAVVHAERPVDLMSTPATTAYIPNFPILSPDSHMLEFKRFCDLRLRSEQVDWINRMTYAKARAMAMGFTFSSFEMEIRGEDVAIGGSWVCVCHQTEMFRTNYWVQTPLHRIDVVDSFADNFSERHLLEDGYSPKDIARFMEHALEFERSGPTPNESAVKMLGMLPPRYTEFLREKYYGQVQNDRLEPPRG